MKIAILSQAYLFDETAPINGSLVQLYNLAQGFHKKNIEVHYICTTRDKSKTENEIINGIHLHWLQTENGLFAWKKSIEQFKTVLEDVSPTAIYVRGRNVLQYVAGHYAKKHNIVFVWGTNGDDSAELYKNVKRLKESKKPIFKKILLFPFKVFEDFYINKGMQMPKYIVNQNTHQKTQTAKHLKKDGIILNSYYFIDDNKDQLQKNQILWLARWSKEKQPELFIQMVSKLKPTNVDVVMVGDTSSSKTMTELAKTAKTLHIKTPGKIAYKNVNGYFANSLVFVNTSYREGVSNTFIEAMLNGVPVLSLNSNPNNWLTDFNIGYCANGNLEQLTNALDDLLGDRSKLKKMSEDAKLFAKQHFSNDAIIDSYIKLFQNNG